MGALILAIIAGVVPVFPFSTEETAYAQTSDRLDDATLAESDGLSLVGENLSPVYARTTTEYTARVANPVNVVTVMVDTNNADATYTISPRDADGSTPGDQVRLQSGRNTPITVTVTAEDRRTRQTYTVMVYRMRSTLSDVATLSALSLDGVSLSPRFSSGTAAYDARVSYDVTTVTLAATAADIGALVSDVAIGAPAPTGAGVVPDDESIPVAVVARVTERVVTLGGVGEDTDIIVTVRPESGTDANTTNNENYTITVYRESGPVLSDIATLAAEGLSLDDSAEVDVPLTPGFVPGTTEYRATVLNAVGFVTVEAAAAGAPGATVEIRPADQDTSDTDHQVYLTPGTNTPITVTVTAEDRRTRQTYTVTVYREGAPASTDATLSALSLDGVSLSPRFSSGTAAYDARVSYDVTTVTLAATAADIGALVSDVAIGEPVPTGAGVVPDDESIPVALVARVTERVVTLGGVGEDTDIIVTVRPESGTDANKNYTITVYRESGPVLSDIATLAAEGLSLDDSAEVDVPLTPGFVPGTTEYTASVGNAVGFVTVEAAAAGAPGATAEIMPADQNSLLVGEGAAAVQAHEVYLTAGAHTPITVTVTAENGSTNTYTVMVYRDRASASTDATLSALSLDGVSLSPTFDPETTAYDARVRYDVSEVTVEHTVVDIGASADLSAIVGGELAEGNIDGNVVTLDDQGTETVIRVTVTAEAATAMPELYVITVYRENIVLSDIATLSNLALNEPDNTEVTLSPEMFAAGITEYTARVDNDVDFVTVEPTLAADPGATFEIMPADQNSIRLIEEVPAHEVYVADGVHTPITVTVTAENGNTNTYTVIVYRDKEPASTVTTLSALSLSGVVLSPDFDPERKNYTARAAYNTDITTVTATTTDLGARVPVISTVPISAQVMGEPNQVTLSNREATTITINVTAEDGTTVTVEDDNDATPSPYKIVVYRDPEPSSDATLETLTLSGLMLSPAFDPATTEYTAEVETLDMTTVVAMAAHPGATVAGTGDKVLAEGEHEITVTVTAEDDETSQAYTVTVTVLTGRTLLEIYDTNDNERIDRNEAVQAIRDYIAGEITRAGAVAIIRLYIAG